MFECPLFLNYFGVPSYQNFISSAPASPNFGPALAMAEIVALVILNHIRHLRSWSDTCTRQRTRNGLFHFSFIIISFKFDKPFHHNYFKKYCLPSHSMTNIFKKILALPSQMHLFKKSLPVHHNCIYFKICLPCHAMT